VSSSLEDAVLSLQRTFEVIKFILWFLHWRTPDRWFWWRIVGVIKVVLEFLSRRRAQCCGLRWRAVEVIKRIFLSLSSWFSWWTVKVVWLLCCPNPQGSINVIIKIGFEKGWEAHYPRFASQDSPGLDQDFDLQDEHR
jgi:hypothetical protein